VGSDVGILAAGPGAKTTQQQEASPASRSAIAKGSPHAVKSLILDSLNPHDVDEWISDMRKGLIGNRGRPLTYAGGQEIFRHIKRVTGIDWAHAHRFRHTWARHALKQPGADRQLIQDAMGWTSDRMARKYQGAVRQRTAAARMPELSPV
jgi:integrase